MIHYTIYRSDNDQLVLVGEQGQTVPATDILQAHPQTRVYAFEGKMGAGKTTFIRQLCQEMGVEDIVNSPTFAIINVYDLPAHSPYGNELYHFDCYRLKSIHEAIDFGAEEYLYSGNYCFIEWPDILAPLLPEDTVTIKIEPMDENTRTLTVE